MSDTPSSPEILTSPDTARAILTDQCSSDILRPLPNKSHQNVISKESIGAIVYGGLDGIITTLVIVLCASGIDISIQKVFKIGMSSLFANALSMAIADYVSIKSEIEFIEMERKKKALQIEADPKSQEDKMVQTYENMGLRRETAGQMVQILSRNKEGFVDIIMIEEAGLNIEAGNPVTSSLITFASFSIFGFIPLVPLLFTNRIGIPQKNTVVVASAVITLGVLFILGFSKSFLVKSKWYISSFETILLGFLASGAAFFVIRAFGQGIIG